MKYVTETKHVPLGFGEIAGGALDEQAVTLKGAVHSLRAMGGITFLALRVRDGAVQCVCRPEELPEGLCEECAAVVYRVMAAASMEVPEGSKTVDLTPGAYDSLYDNYEPLTFTALVPASDTEGPVSFFDQTVFIGDSISMTLEAYCAASGALGGAKFLCAGSMSPTNMLTGQILPEYPKGSGQKPPIEDSVAATGAKVVYVMLGMDNIAYGIDRSTSDYLTILNNIVTKTLTCRSSSSR